jgi:hypothetical protein
MAINMPSAVSPTANQDLTLDVGPGEHVETNRYVPNRIGSGKNLNGSCFHKVIDCKIKSGSMLNSGMTRASTNHGRWSF